MNVSLVSIARQYWAPPLNKMEEYGANFWHDLGEFFKFLADIYGKVNQAALAKKSEKLEKINIAMFIGLKRYKENSSSSESSSSSEESFTSPRIVVKCTMNDTAKTIVLEDLQDEVIISFPEGGKKYRLKVNGFDDMHDRLQQHLQEYLCIDEENLDHYYSDGTFNSHIETVTLYASRFEGSFDEESSDVVFYSSSNRDNKSFKYSDFSEAELYSSETES